MCRTVETRRRLIASLGGLAMVLGFGLADVPSQARAEEPAQAREERIYKEQIVPLLNHYCLKCHNADNAKGQIDLTAYPDRESVIRDRRTWERVIDNVDAGIMPPEGEMPDEAEVTRIVGWIEGALTSAGCETVNPGRVTIRRLNRSEYNNTIRDLMGVNIRPADDFPLDDVGYGFDNIGDVLTVPTLLMEKYLKAAEDVATRAIIVPQADLGPSRSWRGRDLEGGEAMNETASILVTNGELATPIPIEEPGEYSFRILASGDQAGEEAVRMALRVDGKYIQEFEVPNSRPDPQIFEVTTQLDAGEHAISVAFLNDYFNRQSKDRSNRDRNLIVERLEVLGPSGPPLWTIAKFGPRELRGGNGGQGARSLPSNGEIHASVRFPGDGKYRLSFRAYGDQAGPDPVKVGVRINGEQIEVVDVPATQSDPGTYELPIEVARGQHKVALAFLNDYYQPDAEDPRLRGDRNLYVQGLEILGTTAGSLPESHRRVITRTPASPADWEDCAREALEPFLSRAFRRPVPAEEVERFVRFVMMAREDGEPFEQGIRFATMAALVNPQFLYRIESDPEPEEDAEPVDPIRELDSWEMASRLSYFLWSSMPDEELFDLARQGKLQDDEVLEAQVRRMLKDPKAKALITNFGGQWLTLNSLDNASPDNRRFRDFDRKLIPDMRRETELFFQSVMDEDRNILEFIDSDYTFLNEPLAKHYGIEGVEGDEFRRVELPAESPRGGVLTQASILTLTSNPTRTSPVQRGKWILEQILGTPPPPPPPDIPELPEGRQLKGTLRERMEQHRENPNCAVCHDSLDPLGFGFENFDAVGRWRTTDGGAPVDPSGSLPGGVTFGGVEDLKTFLKVERQSQFTRALVEKMLTYALGRGLEFYDDCAVDTIREAVAADGHKFSRLVISVVESDPFRKRLREGGKLP